MTDPKRLTEEELNRFRLSSRGDVHALLAELDLTRQDCKAKDAEIERIKSDWHDDVLFYDEACRYCIMPEVEDAWRHDHDGDGRFHWHHRLDPGDGLVSDCAYSEAFERIYQEGQAEAKERIQQLEQSLHFAELQTRQHSDAAWEVKVQQLERENSSLKEQLAFRLDVSAAPELAEEAVSLGQALDVAEKAIRYAVSEFIKAEVDGQRDSDMIMGEELVDALANIAKVKR